MEKLEINILELIKEKKCRKFFVLDTDQDGLSEKITYNDGDITYNRYCYSRSRYNKLEPNAIFLYRQTKRSSKNRKFYFFGGGIIKEIKDVSGPIGSVEAIITEGFKLKEPIYEDDPKLNNIVWTSKNKKLNSWDHFWNQYGMNEITKEEFLAILGDTVCLDASFLYKEQFLIDYTEEDKSIKNTNMDIGEFKGNYEEEILILDNPKNISIKKNIARHIDFNKLNKKKKTLGTFGEMLVYRDENAKLASLNINKEAEHVALTKGDGLGYDFISYDENGKEVYIEVKTTSTNRVDKFYLSPKELEIANNEKFNYKIYRVYNLDMKTGTYDVKIFDGKEISNICNLIPVSYRVEFK